MGKHKVDSWGGMWYEYLTGTFWEPVSGYYYHHTKGWYMAPPPPDLPWTTAAPPQRQPRQGRASTAQTATTSNQWTPATPSTTTTNGYAPLPQSNQQQAFADLPHIPAASQQHQLHHPHPHPHRPHMLAPPPSKQQLQQRWHSAKSAATSNKANPQAKAKDKEAKSQSAQANQQQPQTSPLGEMRALVRLTNAVFTRDRLVARDLNRYTEEDVRNYLHKLGFVVGKPPVVHWGCPQGKYQVLADILSWILSATNEYRLRFCTSRVKLEEVENDGLLPTEPQRMRIVVSEEQAQLCVPYKPGSPYVASDAVLHELGLPIRLDDADMRWSLPFDRARLSAEGAALFGHVVVPPGEAAAHAAPSAPPVPLSDDTMLLDIDADLLLDPYLVGCAADAPPPPAAFPLAANSLEADPGIVWSAG